MPYIVNRNFSRFYDMKTGTEFLPQLDLAAGCFVGATHVDDAKAGEFEGREGFEILDADEYVALTIAPPAPAPPEPATGAALTDQQAAKQADQAQTDGAPALPGPPPPPASR